MVMLWNFWEFLLFNPKIKIQKETNGLRIFQSGVTVNILEF